MLERLTATRIGETGVSTLTAAELAYGVERSRDVARNRQIVQRFLLPLAILPFDEAAALHYGAVRAELESTGSGIGPIDMLLAAQARSVGAVMVTNNVREFSRVSGLAVEDWTKA